MCKFCKEEKGNTPIMFEAGSENQIQDKLSIIKEGNMFVLRLKNKYEKISEIAEIKFCPMCGRELKEE